MSPAAATTVADVATLVDGLVAQAQTTDLASLGANQLDVSVSNPYAEPWILATSPGDASKVWLELRVHADGPTTVAKVCYFRADGGAAALSSLIASAAALLPAMLAGNPDPAAHAAIEVAPVATAQLVGKLKLEHRP